jgi:hypothetical protein
MKNGRLVTAALTLPNKPLTLELLDTLFCRFASPVEMKMVTWLRVIKRDSKSPRKMAKSRSCSSISGREYRDFTHALRLGFAVTVAAGGDVC